MTTALRILIVGEAPAKAGHLCERLAQRKPEWHVLTAISGQEALHLMQTSQIDVLAADMFVLLENDCSLLQYAATAWPACIRIALSPPGCMTKTQDYLWVHQHVTHDDTDAFISKITQVLSWQDFMLDAKIQRLITSVTALPMMPDVFLNIREELSKPSPNPTQIAALISQDIALSAKILSLINAPCFALGRKIDSLLQAVNLLGLDTIQVMVLSTQLFLKSEELETVQLSLRSLSEHSQRVAAICGILGEYLGIQHSIIARCTLAALLHDIGKLILSACFPVQFCQAVDMLRQTDMSLCEAERIIFGTTHAELGAYLLALWGMDEDLVLTIARHHRKIAIDNSAQMLLHIADVMDHNCVRIHETHHARNFNMPDLATCTGRDLLQDWATHVATVWARQALRPLFEPRFLFPGAAATLDQSSEKLPEVTS